MGVSSAFSRVRSNSCRRTSSCISSWEIFVLGFLRRVTFCIPGILKKGDCLFSSFWSASVYPLSSIAMGSNRSVCDINFGDISLFARFLEFGRVLKKSFTSLINCSPKRFNLDFPTPLIAPSSARVTGFIWEISCNVEFGKTW